MTMNIFVVDVKIFTVVTCLEERFGRERFRNPSGRFITIEPELIKVCPILLALLSSNQSEKETSEKHT